MADIRDWESLMYPEPDVSPLERLRRERLSRQMTHEPSNALSNQEAMDAVALGMAPVPFAGDIAGLAADAHRFKTDPESRTALNFGLSGLGLLPFMPNMTVFHGSPHLFDKFKIAEKMGTGEGAQAYGHGAYLAEKPGVARQYMEFGQPDTGKIHRMVRYKGADVDVADLQGLEGLAVQSVHQKGGDVAQTIADYEKQLSDPMLPKRFRDRWKDVPDWLRTHGDQIEPFTGELPAGALYEVDLPDEAIDKMLDWDAPLSEQPGALERALIAHDKAIPRGDINARREFASFLDEYYSGELKSGGDLHQRMIAAVGKENAADVLREAGIPGIKYFDGGSRAAGEGTRNFVVFPGNEDLLTILKRNDERLTP